jgi:hypothetical protein
MRSGSLLQLHVLVERSADPHGRGAGPGTLGLAQDARVATTRGFAQ